MTSTALSLATSASSIVEATGLAAQFKSIVPSDLFIALGLGFLIGIVIAVVYALASTGRFSAVWDKIRRAGSEMTGGAIGKKPDKGERKR